MEFSKADFSITCANEGCRATVKIDGAEKPRSDCYGRWLKRVACKLVDKFCCPSNIMILKLS